MVEPVVIKPHLEVSFVLRDKDGNIKEQGTEKMDIEEMMDYGNTNK